MKRGIVWAALLILACTSLAAVSADLHQVGTAASGRAGANGRQLQSVVGQTSAWMSGNLTSGFLSLFTKPAYVAGDADGSGSIDISDVIFLIAYIFNNGPAPSPETRGDADCSGGVDISDAVFLVAYIFGGGGAPEYCH